MTVFGWIMSIVFSGIALFFIYKFFMDIIWHNRLNKFRENHELEIEKIKSGAFIRNGYVSVLSIFVIMVMVMTQVPNPVINHKTYVDAQSVASYQSLNRMIADSQSAYRWDIVPEGAGDGLEGDVSADDVNRSYTDTNIQVEGVDEADVIKTDGYQIYYAPAYGNQLYVFDVLDSGEIILNQTIDLDTYYIEGIFLTDTKVILIGYAYEENPYYYSMFDYGWYYTDDTASVLIYDRTDLTLDFSLTTDSHFYQYRLIDNMLYLLSQKYLYTDLEEYRPSYETTSDGIENSYLLPYEDIFYFEDYQTNSMSVITSINLDDYTYQAQAFMVSISLIYANTNSLYAISYGYNYDNDSYQSFTRILKFRFDEEKVLTYVANADVQGYIENQYWMDEYDGYFRVVTSSWQGDNRLYIFEEDETIDKLNEISMTTDGLGEENERVKSVRFNGDIAQVVTFETHDPLYTIDLSNPLSPVIEEGEIIEDGYSAYLHVWGNDDYLVGFGFDADQNGFTTGLKLSAYDTNISTPLDTYSFADNDETHYYSYSEAIYNPRALLINVEKGLFAFPVNSYSYQEIESDYDWSYTASYYIFKVDFNQSQVIEDPIIISHDETEYYNAISRGIEIENRIYTFSRDQVYAYDLNTHSTVQVLNFM